MCASYGGGQRHPVGASWKKKWLGKGKPLKKTNDVTIKRGEVCQAEWR